MANQPVARGAQRQTDGHLPLARPGAGEQQICNVHAGDEQHESDNTKKDQQSRADIARQILLQRHDAQRPAEIAGIGIGILLAQRVRERIELRLRRRDAHARMKPGQRALYEACYAVRRIGKRPGRESRGSPYFDAAEKRAAGMLEVGRHDPDDGVKVQVNAHPFPDDVRIRAEPAPPRSIAQDRHCPDSLHVILRAKHPPQGRVHSQHGKIAVGIEQDFHARRLLASGKVAVDGERAGNPVEDLLLFL